MIFGLIPSTPDDVTHPKAAVWAHKSLSPRARLVAARLAEAACDLSGEVFADYWKVTHDCGLHSLTDFSRAVDELVAEGVLLFQRYMQTDAGDEIILTAFNIDDRAYYGDDTNPPPDFEFPDNDANAWEYGLDEESYKDPDPRRARIYAKTDYRCFYCVEAWAEHLDHMHPSSRGGSNADENMIGACRACNVQKKDRTVDEYRAWLAYRRKLTSVSEVHFYGESQA